ncbi:unnamed protein product [Brassica oleracea]
MKLSGVFDSGKTNGEAAVPSIPVKPVAQTGDSSGDLSPPVRSNQSAKSVPLPASTSVLGAKPLSLVSSSAKYKAIARDNVGEMITFKDMTFGPHEGEVRFQLIHFWEAWNAQTKVLIGLEMLLIDEEENVIQGFILYGRIKTYLRHMKAGATYRLNKFFGSKSKTIYRVAEPSVTISFSWNYVLSVLEDSSICFPEDRFRIHGYREFEAASDLRGDLYGSSDSIMLDEAEIVASRRVDLHVQTHDDPVLKLYLWDKAAFEFCEKFKAPEGTARVLSLSSMAFSRVFLDSDVQETRFYLSWLNSNLDVANRVNVEVVTKPETATLGELFSYMNQASAKVAWFECTSTIDDVVHGSGWYYIGCGVCHTKATKGSTTLMCKKCGKSEIVGVAQYLSKLSAYDHNGQAVFVVLGEELTGKKAAELVERYYQTRRFIVMVSNYNMTGKTQTLTVTKVLPLKAPEPEGNLGENVDEEPDNEKDDHADE